MLHRTLMNGKTAVKFVRYLYNEGLDHEVLRFIADRQCTAVREEQCIVARPKEPKDWCSRCLALDHLICREKEEKRNGA